VLASEAAAKASAELPVADAGATDIAGRLQ